MTNFPQSLPSIFAVLCLPIGKSLLTGLQLQRLLYSVAFTIIIICGAFSTALGQGQPGSNDTSFDTGDVIRGAGEGFNNTVRAIAFQSDGKMFMGGEFSSYNRIPTSKYLIRLQPDGSHDASFTVGSSFNGNVYALVLQSDGKLIVGGDFTSYNGTARNRIARLNADGTLDDTFDPGSGFDAKVLSVALQQDGRVLVGGSFTSYNGTPRNRIARLNADGSLDESFQPGNGFDDDVNTIVVQSDGSVFAGGKFVAFNGTGASRITLLNPNGTFNDSFKTEISVNGPIHAMARQRDGKLVISGEFSYVNGISQSNVARLHPDGSLDESFDTGTGLNSFGNAVALQNDDKMILAGNFTSYNGIGSNRIARLHPNGALDTSFNIGAGLSSRVESMALQTDGKIVVGGVFNTYDGIAQNRIARINPDGALDAAFNPAGGFNQNVNDIIALSDDKLLVGGTFKSYNGQPSSSIARLLPDGKLDDTFTTGTGFWGGVNSLALQNDGKIIAGGSFTSFNGTVRNKIARLNPNGTLDDTFDPGLGVDYFIRAVALQPDGKVVAGGFFSTFDGTPCFKIVRLNPDGSRDLSFNSGTGFSSTNDMVWAIAIQPDGKILVGGDLTSYNLTPVNGIVRLNIDGSLDNTFIAGTGFNGRVMSIVLQPDEKIIVGGGFTHYNGEFHNMILRLNTDGTPDPTFSTGTSFSSSVHAVSLQNNGKIVVGGAFTSFNGTARRSIARLHANGTLDDTFNSGTGFSHSVLSLALQSDGKVVAGGNFISLNSIARTRIARLYGGEGPVLSAAKAHQPGLDVLLYPNPSQGDINLEFSGAEALVGGAKLTLYDAMGREVYKKEVTAAAAQAGVQLSTAGHARGVYFLQISTRSGVVTKRVVLAE